MAMTFVFSGEDKTPTEILLNLLDCTVQARASALRQAERLEGEAKAERDAAEKHSKQAEVIRAAIETLQKAV